MKEKNRILLLVAAITIFIAVLPLLQENLVVGDDYEYHLARIESIKDTLKARIFPVKIHTQMGPFYGYGSGLFYPNLFLYIPALLELLGMNLVLSYKVFIGIMLILLFFLSYISIKHITEDEKSALIGTILVVLSKTVILNLYHRFALGEFLGFIFIPLVIAGIYDFIYKDFKNPLFLGIGFFGLIHTHLISTVICLIFCILYCIIHIKTFIKHRKNILKLLFVALLTIMASISFWLPMLEQFTIQEYRFSEPWVHITSNVFRLIDALGNSRYGLGFSISLCIPLCVFAIFDRNVKKEGKEFALWGILILFIQTNHTFWEKTQNITDIFQFKWRLIGITTILFSIAISDYIKDILQRYKIKFQPILILTIIITSYFSIEFMNYDNKMENTKTLEELTANNFVYGTPNALGGGKEYLPIETDPTSLIYPKIAFSSVPNKQIPVTKSILSCTFQVDAEDRYCDVPFIYYKGYVANIMLEDGEIKQLTVQKSDNRISKNSFT